jgi:hypothetical protein
MSKIDEPPFKDSPNPNNAFWSLSWFEWLRDIWTKVNERPALVGDGTENNFPKFNADADLIDSDKAVPTGDVVGTTDTQTLTNKTSDYYNITEGPIDGNHATRKSYVDGKFEDEVNGRFLTENLVPEAGLEPAIIIRCSDSIEWALLPDGNDLVLYVRNNGPWTETSRWVYTDYL